MHRYQRPILLTSLPRSGSTWALRVLEHARNVKGVFEPDHLDVNRIARNGMHPFVNVDTAWPEYEKIYKDAFNGIKRPTRYSSRSGVHTLINNGIRSLGLDGRRAIVKTVYSIHNTQWLYAKFNPFVVVLLRNPFSIIHSIHRKWPEAMLGDIANQDELMDTYLKDYKKQICSAETPLSILAAHVGAYYKIVLDQASKNPEWRVVKHEDLCMHPEAEFKSLFNDLNLEWNKKVDDFIERTNKPKENDKVMHVKRLSQQEVNKWKDLLTADQCVEIMKFYGIYEGLPYRDLLAQMA